MATSTSSTRLRPPRASTAIDGTTGQAKGLFTKGVTLTFPFGIALDGSGSMYFMDPAPNACHVLRYDPGGN